MRKNKMMRLASALLVAVLLSTCAISGTFAKYVTTESGSDTARVAKWGVELVVDSFKLFATDYEKTDSGFAGTYTVSSSNGDKLLAPGTDGKFADIAITGTPEVAVEVKVEATVALSDNWIVDGDFYCPIEVTVGTTTIKGTDHTSAADFAAAIEAAIEGYTAEYEPNKDLSTIDANFDISWAWAFYDSDANDVKDTKLGDKAVAEDLTFSVDLAITVTQID